ncbi:hypothetical protein MTR67_040784 [Solanum verrucosum]|uniref:RNase H type-1 domain-containing protein n=1 Tax=Solanum verrucosum TaxID=315347 RepID=A0AAF0ULF6_SOLVR|nr:hypothetical protein MTR67_040784 [Solanum verrucosum]
MKMVEGVWHKPWEVTMEVRRIQILKDGLEVAIVHTLREGNKLTDFMANIVFSFAGTNSICYNDFQDLPSEAKTILNMDKSQIPNLRIRKFQNGGFAQD